MERYRYVCTTLNGFVQRAVVIASSGYGYFVSGEVPGRKSAEAVDDKMLSKYGLRLTRRQRHYRKSAGKENGHYFRHDSVWVLMATHPSFFLEKDKKEAVMDMREEPLRVGGYSVWVQENPKTRKKTASAWLSEKNYRELRGYFESIAVQRSEEEIAGEMWRVSNEWQVYSPVHHQFRVIVGAVNKKRKRAGLKKVPVSCVRVYRPLPKHFEGGETRPVTRNGQ